MGGAKGYSFDSQDLKKLEEKAKEKLREGSGSKGKNVFISFVEEDLNEVNLLRGQAKNDKSDLEFSDYSVKEPYDSTRADYIKQKIREKIQKVSTTIVYISTNTSSSKWVKWEVEESLKMGKKVIAVHKGDSPPRNPPSYLAENKIKLVKWAELSSNLE